MSFNEEFKEGFHLFVYLLLQKTVIVQLKVGLGAGKGGFAHSFDFEDSTVGRVANVASGGPTQ